MEESINKALRKPFDKSEIDRIPKDGVTLDYVGHASVTKRLLDADPDWTWEPLGLDPSGAPAITIINGEASLWIKLTVGGVTRIGVGCESTHVLWKGVEKTRTNLNKQLISDAIRNAAMRFGVALDLWKKHDTTDPIAAPAKTRARPAKPAASAPVGSIASGDDPWQDILNNTDGWFDNRGEKAAGTRNANYPDFKAKRGNEPFDTMGTNKDGSADSLALWLNSAPDGFDIALQALDAGEEHEYEPIPDFAEGAVRGDTTAEAVATLKGIVEDEYPDPEKEPF